MKTFFLEKFTEIPIEKGLLKSLNKTYGDCFKFGVAVNGGNYCIVEDNYNNLIKWHVYDKLMFNYLIISGQTYSGKESNFYLQEMMFPVGDNTDLQNALMSVVLAIALQRLGSGLLGAELNIVAGFASDQNDRINKVLTGISYRVNDNRIIEYEY